MCRALFHTFYYYWAEKYGSLNRGLRHIGVRYNTSGFLCNTADTTVIRAVVAPIIQGGRMRYMD